MLDKQLTEMIFAIDYDGTYSERPQEISDFIECLLLNGDAAIIATGRTGEKDPPPNIRGDKMITKNGDLVPIVYCGDRLKRVACLEAGYEVSIWMDDMPGTIELQRILGLPAAL